MLENAVRVCEAKFGVLFRYSDNAYHVAATLDVPPAYAEFLGRRSFRPDVEPALAGSPLHRLLLSKEIVQSDDVSLEATRTCGSVRGSTVFYCRAAKKGKRTGRGFRHLSAGGGAIYRKTHRARHDLARASRDRHREHAAA